jgi:hypothetical protein
MVEKQWNMNENATYQPISAHKNARKNQPTLRQPIMVYSIAGDSLIDAFIRSWTNQKKEYESEIRKLRDEVTMLRANLDNMQMRQLQRDVYQGRNTVSRGNERLGKFDHSNSEIITGFCKNRLFPLYKFLEPSMLLFLDTIKGSLCVKLNKLIEKPREVVTQMDNEYFWSNKTVPIINKKYCEIRSNFNAEIKKVYIGE